MLYFTNNGTGITEKINGETTTFSASIDSWYAEMRNAKPSLATFNNTNLWDNSTDDSRLEFSSTMYHIFNQLIYLDYRKNKRGDIENVPALHVTTSSRSARPNEDGYMSRFNPVTAAQNGFRGVTAKVYQLCITRIERGMNYFPALDTWVSVHGEELNVTPVAPDKLEMLKFGIDIKHIRAYIHNNRLIVYTDYYGQNWANKVYSFMPTMFPELAYLLKEDCPCRNIFAALYDNNANRIEQLLLDMKQYWDTIAVEGVYENLQKVLERNAKRGRDYALQLLENARRNVQDTLRAYNDCMIQYTEAEATAKRFETEDITADLSIIDYLKKSKNVTLKRCDEETDYYVAEIVTPITNFRNADLESWYKRQNYNTLTQYPQLAALLYDALINGEYKLITTTVFRIPINKRNTNWHADKPNKTKGWANPHLSNYQCWHNGQVPADNAIIKGDYVTALNYAIAACGTITFTDSAVLTRMVGELTGSNSNTHIWQDKEGIMYSTNELIHGKYFNCKSNAGTDIIKFIKDLHEHPETTVEPEPAETTTPIDEITIQF